MHVDRSRFLLLTAAIASAGCGPKPATQAPVDRADALGGQPLVVVQTEPPPPEQAEGSGARLDRPSPEPDEEARDRPSASLGPADPQPPGTRAPSMLGAQCRALRPPPGPHCESIDSTPEECESYERVLVPEAAARATACLASKSGKRSICKFGVTVDCFMEGSRVAPPDRQAQAACAPVLRQCAANRWGDPDMTAANCQAAFSAVRPGQRMALLSCITEGCGVGSCFYQLGPR